MNEAVTTPSPMMKEEKSKAMPSSGEETAKSAEAAKPAQSAPAA
jgi:hypothetical protein